MLKIGICDDEAQIVKDIRGFIDQSTGLKGLTFTCDTFLSAESLWRQYIYENSYDILFLDIKMKNMNGIELARKIREVDSDVILIYISAYEKYWMELFEVEPFRFLKKPVTLSDLNAILEKAVCRIVGRPRFFEFFSNRALYRVKLQDIVYFESRGRVIYAQINGVQERFYGKIDSIQESIKNTNVPFIRIHQSFLVNFNFVKKLGYTKVLLLDNTELCISEDRQKIIRKQYMHYWDRLND